MNLIRTICRVNGLATIFALLVLLSLNWGMPAVVEASDIRAAFVQGIEGEVDMSTDTKSDVTKLRPGDAVDLWTSISTGLKGKLLLQWDNSLMISLGRYSSLLLSTQSMEGSLRRNIDVTEGIVRSLHSHFSNGYEPRPLFDYHSGCSRAFRFSTRTR